MNVSTTDNSKQRQFLLFVLTSGFAALVNFGSRIVFSYWMPFSIAIVASFVFGMLTAFTLSRLFVFREAGNALHQQIFWFTVVNLVALLQTLIVSLLLVDQIFPRVGFHWHTETVAHAIGVGVPVLTSFIGHKHLSFRAR